MQRNAKKLNTEAPITLPPIFNQPAIIHHVPSRTSNDFANFHNKQEQKKQFDTVVACLILEAGGEGVIGMEAVNEVINNRAQKKYKSNNLESLYKIVVAPKQFSCFNSGLDNAVLKAKKHPMWNVASKIVANNTTNHTHGATFYHTTQINPTWAQFYKKNGAQITKLGHHLFYKI